MVAVGCAGVVGWWATQGTAGDNATAAATLTVVAVLSALFAYRRIGNSSAVRLDEAGVLTIEMQDKHVFDLASPSTQVEMVGQPGQPDWRINLLRRSMSPVTITSRAVDPHAFTEALRQWRPDL